MTQGFEVSDNPISAVCNPQSAVWIVILRNEVTKNLNVELVTYLNDRLCGLFWYAI